MATLTNNREQLGKKPLQFPLGLGLILVQQDLKKESQHDWAASIVFTSFRTSRRHLAKREKMI